VAGTQLCRTARLVRDDPRPTKVDRAAALSDLESTLRRSGAGIVVVTDDAPGDYQIAVDGEGKFEIANPAGEPIPHLEPAIDVGAPSAAARVAARLAHLSRYRTTLELDNPAPAPSLRNRFGLELLWAQRSDDSEFPPPRSFESLDAGATVRAGDYVVLRLRNGSSEPLNVAGFDLDDGYAVTRVLPNPSSVSAEILEPGVERDFYLETFLPDGWTEATDVFKIVATTASVNFFWLELPSLDNPLESTRRATRSLGSALDQLLATLALEQPATRDLLLAGAGRGDPWLAVETTVRVVVGDDAKRLAIAAARQRIDDLYRAGQLREAIAAARGLSDDIKARLGERHPDYALSLDNLALLLRQAGELGEAESLLDRVIQLREAAPTADPPALAGSYDNLATVSLDKGDYARAEQLYLRAQEIWGGAQKQARPEYGVSLVNLGSLYCTMGRYKEAEDIFCKALDQIALTEGEDRPAFASGLNNLATVYKAMGDYGSAEAHYRRAMEILRKTYGENHPSYAATLFNLASVCVATGRLDEAARLLAQTLDIERRSLGESHPNYANTLDSLGAILKKQGKLEDAASLFRQAADIRRSKLGEDHPDYAISLNNLADIAVAEGRPEEAIINYRRALDLVKARVGDKHPDVAVLLRNLAAIERDQGKLDDAQRDFTAALAIDEAAFGSEDPKLILDLQGLASTLQKLGKTSEAKEWARRVSSILAAALGPDHPLTQKALADVEAIA
jgi:tetratricopeptide (TPR) repeat protein